MDDLMKKLTAPFPVAHLRWRMGNRPHQVGREWRVRLLAYIEKSHVERRLDEVFGGGELLDAWGSELIVVIYADTPDVVSFR